MVIVVVEADTAKTTVVSVLWTVEITDRAVGKAQTLQITSMFERIVLRLADHAGIKRTRDEEGDEEQEMHEYVENGHKERLLKDYRGS